MFIEFLVMYKPIQYDTHTFIVSHIDNGPPRNTHPTYYILSTLFCNDATFNYIN